MSLPVLQPSRVTVMIKPAGAMCNMDCTYCYYLPTKTIYAGHEKRMSLRTLEDIYASILPRFDDEVTIAWQGGEPTLAGLPFFRKAIEFQQRYARPGQRIHHALQTNGTLLDDEWCQFLRQYEFLIGLSVDGPPRFHDHYRITNSGQSSSDLVLRGLRLLQKNAVEYNILCVLNDVNVDHPDEILHYLLNLGSRWLQFIPAIEWVKDPRDPARNILAPYSPEPEAYGRFLCRVFDLWFEKYRKRVSIRIIDALLNKLVLGAMPFCILDGSCHNQITIEHDGAVFGCDHFVERRWQLGQIGDADWSNAIQLDGTASVGLTVHGSGYQKLVTHAGRNIASTNDLPGDDEFDRVGEESPDDNTNSVNKGACDETWFDRLDSGRLGSFASRKQNLPPKCLACQWKPYCHGGCPKHRSMGGDVPEPTILCAAYMIFYEHAMPKLQWLADYLRRDTQPPGPEEVAPTIGGESGCENPAASMAGATNLEVLRQSKTRANPVAGRNDPCPCGSGLKFKKCHGRNL